MNIKLVKGIAAFVCIGSALAMTYQPNPKAAEATKTATASKEGKDLLITNPEKESEYGIGTYKVEGLVSKGTEVTLFLDRKELKTFTTNTEDGSYLEDIEIKEPGDHVLVAQYKDAKGEKVLRKLEFKAKDKENPTGVEKNKDLVAENADAGNKDDAEATNLLPEDTGDDVAIVEDPNDPNNSAHRAENGAKPVKDLAKPKATTPAGKKPTAKPPVAKKPAAKPAAAKKPTAKPSVAKKSAAAKKPMVTKKPLGKKPASYAFAISSHTNFNVVPHGVLQIGGKGKPGDKVMLYVDNKLSMKGTVKPNGRWKFPVKIAAAGFRQVKAQNVRTKEVKAIKLKIK